MTRKRKGKSIKANAKKIRLQDAEVNKAPHSLVFSRGEVGVNLQQLTYDVRKVMEPYTASNLKVRKKNVLKDFVAISGPLGVTHMIMMSKTGSGANMRIARLPQGPTLHFKVDKYCLSRDVISSLKRPKVAEGQFRSPPLLVLNNFGAGKSQEKSEEGGASVGNGRKLCATLLQNMFPTLNVHKLTLNTVRRCVLFNFAENSDRIEFRHYNISVKAKGVSRRIDKLVGGKNAVPNLSKYKEVSDFLTHNQGSASETDGEVNDPASQLEMPKTFGSKTKVNQLTAVRLTELGPRMQLRLYKIEAGLCGGEVLFHSFVSKSKEEKEQTEKKRVSKTKLRESRRLQQEQNVKKKEALKEMNKKRSMLGINRAKKTVAK